MAWRDWGVPLLVGLVGGGLLYAIPLPDAAPKPPGSHIPSDETPSGWDDGWVFPEGPRVAALPSATDVLFVAPPGRAEDLYMCFIPEGCLDAPNLEHPPMEPATSHVYLGRASDYRIVCIRAPCDQPEAPYYTRDADPLEARFGVEGYNATRLRIYVFDEEGRVLASSAPDADLARFDLADGFSGISDVAWYLGDQEAAPAGTVKPPGPFAPYMDRVRNLLQGLPVGGVATTTASHWAVGDLFLTARIEELVQAP